jgi:hypothetical protein
VDTLCLYCSDGRFAVQTAEFLVARAGQGVCDRLVVPGGPGSLAGGPAVWREGEVLAESVRFLQRAHDLKRVILVAHEDCGFYQGRLGLDPGPGMQTHQLEDLRKAVARVRGFASAVEVEAYFARILSGQVCFERVEC